MAERIAVTFQKGGVGKTFTAKNLAGGLNERGFDVLLVDLDPQGTLTDKVGKGELFYTPGHPSLDEVLLGDATDWGHITDLILTDHDEFDFIPSNTTFTGNRSNLDNSDLGTQRLDKALRHVDDDYDYIIFDTPPALDAYTKNGIIASKNTGLVVPVAPIDEMVHSTTLLFDMIESFEAIHEIDIRFLAFLLNLTDYSSQSNDEKEMISWFHESFDDRISFEIRDHAALSRDTHKADSIYAYEEARNDDQFPIFDEFVDVIVRQTKPAEDAVAKEV